MIKENTKFIIATNYEDDGLVDDTLNTNIIEPIYDLTDSDSEILFRPSEALMAYATYKTAAEGKIPIIVPVGGDGTINWHLNNSDIYPPGSIFLPLAHGTANDISSTIHKVPSNFRHILQHGRLRQAKPLSIENGNKRKKALGYIGLGITGQCAKEINNSNTSDPSLIHDSMVSIKGIIKSRKIKIKQSKDHDLSKRYSEITAINSRMASFLWPKHPAIFEDHFFLLSPKGYINTANLALAGLKRKLVGKKINIGHSVEFEIENLKSKNRPIYGQCDGEEFILENGPVIINKSNRPINLISSYF